MNIFHWHYWFVYKLHKYIRISLLDSKLYALHCNFITNNKFLCSNLFKKKITKIKVFSTFFNKKKRRKCSQVNKKAS